MSDAEKYSVMVVANGSSGGTTIHEYPAERVIDTRRFFGKARRLRTNSWMVGPNPTMTKD
jgi:hypothetical protein